MIRLIKTFLLIFFIVLIANSMFKIFLHGFKYFVEGDGGYSVDFKLTVGVIVIIFVSILIMIGLLLTKQYNIYIYGATSLVIETFASILSFFTPSIGFFYSLMTYVLGSWVLATILFYIKKEFINKN